MVKISELVQYITWLASEREWLLVGPRQGIEIWREVRKIGLGKGLRTAFSGPK